MNESDLGSYNVAQIFAWRLARFGQPLMRVPTEQKLVGFALIRYAANEAQVDLMLNGAGTTARTSAAGQCETLLRPEERTRIRSRHFLRLVPRVASIYR